MHSKYFIFYEKEIQNALRQLMIFSTKFVFLRIYKLEEVQHIWNTSLFKTNNNYGEWYK